MRARPRRHAKGYEWERIVDRYEELCRQTARRAWGRSRAAPRVVGVVPAAGHATRLQPLASAKEMVPVGGAR